MNADKAREVIQQMLQRTEANGAYPSEVESAERKVCRLLREFPELLGGTSQPQQRRAAPTKFDERRDPDAVSIRYEGILSRDEQGMEIIINGNIVWFDYRTITVKTRVIWMTRSLAEAKGLI
jgi:hypothetical protein